MTSVTPIAYQHVAYRIILCSIVVATFFDSATANAQSGSFVPVRRSAPRTVSVDAETAWTFRMKQDVVLSSPIVRLGDIIVPLDPNLPQWSRLSRASVGLLPVDGTAMRIDRERLAKLIVRAEATPHAILWVGGESTSIRYLPSAEESQQDTGEPALGHSTIRQTSYHPRIETAATAVPQAALPPEFANRVIAWIEQAIARGDRDLLKRYQLIIDPQQPAMLSLESARGIEQAHFLSPIQEGKCSLYVKSRGLNAAVEATMIAELKENPLAVTTANNLRPGVRIGASDLRTLPIEPENWEDSFYTDPSELIGTETKSYLRKDEPIRIGDVGKPTLIRRGDLLEVRVVNGSISVTTNAKAQGDGAESDLIEIETLDPRKRLIARVVQSGLVEIVTRSPRTR
ncbi:flagellar basal body P-ring biosynthesis protein FlgA [Novipirellula aureliae]|uniref:Flagellar basal body P-ring biosynthesis protein FlgA n=1 Tax=Novipirellula aureliae TaxID=2527966 RepID=A0A5C6E9G5_9BACT|nr:flagellar basal body P-ring formation chaperone FlgA [Novipirellula aureliae]TWU45165.1 flagellar basal body P-ring biosynthesis protein FlgA [Novipirellula aureliae]